MNAACSHVGTTASGGSDGRRGRVAHLCLVRYLAGLISYAPMVRQSLGRSGVVDACPILVQAATRPGSAGGPATLHTCSEGRMCQDAESVVVESPLTMYPSPSPVPE